MNRLLAFLAFVISLMSTATAQTVEIGPCVLFKPLGTKIEITGASPTNGCLIANPIVISAIDRKPLSVPIIMEVRPYDKLGKIEKGYLYTFVGYESGGFEGSPSWMGQVQQYFQFQHYFIVTELVEKKQTSVSTVSAK